MHARHLASCLALAVGLSTTGAVAQLQGGLSLDRFQPSERGSDWFSQESLDLRGKLRPALGVVLDYAHKPLVLTSGDREIAAIVENQMFLHVGGSLVLVDRIRVGVNLPIAVMNDGGSGFLNTTAVGSAESKGVGDLRLGADLRLLGEYGQPFNLALGGQVHLPTGKKDSFTGDDKIRIVPRLMMAGDVGSLAYAANVRFNYRGNEDVGSEVGFGGSVGLRMIDRKLLIGPELYGSTKASSGTSPFKEKGTPMEVILGAHYTAGDFRIGAGAGPGLSRGVGTPDVRVLASLEWFPQVKEEHAAGPSDRDGDGITDDKDACPDQAGEPNDDPKKNGCPPPADRDGDGILDEKDACPDQPGVEDSDPAKNGCPPPADRDKDGIVDEKDACPDEPGVMNDDPKKNGCPPPKDTDGDTILDDVDACPNDKGVANQDPKKHGCPKARLVGKKIEILDRIEFDTGRATLRPESDKVLNEVLAIMKEYEGIKKISIEGHTDNKGGRAANVTLSKNRAASVLKWLVAHGIAKTRLTSNGFGPDKPRDTNDTEEGRQNNRRVEFNIVEGEAVKHIEVPHEGATPPAGATGATGETPAKPAAADAPAKPALGAAPKKKKK